jgi:hypothetical protein
MLTNLRRAGIAAAILALGLGLAWVGTTRAAGQPPRGQGGRPPGPPGQRGPQDGRQPYSIEQATSEGAQLHTVAFSGLAFVTGDFGAATFLPPGKVCDFFGFQYMRDIDAAEKGHNPIFLDRVAGNVLRTLDDGQRALFERAARAEAAEWQVLAERRLPVIDAFYRQLRGNLPPGSSGLNQDSVARYLGELFAHDAELSCRRGQVYGQVAAALTPAQKAYLGKMKFGDFATWPDVDMEQYKLPRGTEKLVNVVYMTYASEFFSWYAGSVEADTYFCPERHGTYFGGFYMKDMPAMGQRDFDISMTVTGDSGEAFLEALTPEQRGWVTGAVERQSGAITEIVAVRRAIATELRRFLKGETPDRDKVVALGRRYGELDGRASYAYATAFAQVGQTLTAGEKSALMRLRNLEGYTSAPAYLFSDPLRGAPALPSTDHFFFPPK